MSSAVLQTGLAVGTTVRLVRASLCGTILVVILAAPGSGAAAQASSGTESARAQVAPAAAPLWRCWWSPTMDDNWHNDALCSNGVTQVRPHLRPNDTYITRDELMRSARAWARARNRSR
ncbi:hypothetical protein GCM10009797_04930 [Nocardioides hwasunensis]